MVLGQEDILKKVEKLVPQLTKICSHELGSADPDRGESYFHNHPSTQLATQSTSKPIRWKIKSKSILMDLPTLYYHFSRFYTGLSGCH